MRREFIDDERRLQMEREEQEALLAAEMLEEVEAAGDQHGRGAKKDRGDSDQHERLLQSIGMVTEPKSAVNPNLEPDFRA